MKSYFYYLSYFHLQLVEAREIKGTTISIHDDGNQGTPGAYLPQSTVKFRISMVTNVRNAGTYMNINFGDQSGSKTFSLATNGIAAGVDSSNYVIDHVYLVESFADGCHLVVEIHHQFELQVCYVTFNDQWHKLIRTIDINGFYITEVPVYYTIG